MTRGAEIQSHLAEFERRTSSDESRKAYRAAIGAFFASARGGPSELRPEHVEAWRDSMLAAGRSVHTVAQRLAILRAFYRLLVAKGAAPSNIASVKNCRPPSLPRSPSTEELTPGEAAALLATPARGSVAGARDYAVMLLLLRLGLRVSDLCSLKEGDLEPGRPLWTLRVGGRGGEAPPAELPTEVRQAIQAYLGLDAANRRLLHCGGPAAPLFQTVSGTHRSFRAPRGLSQRAVEMLVARYAELAGLTGSRHRRRVTPYALRRTFLKARLDEGRSHEEVAAAAGLKRRTSVARHERPASGAAGGRRRA